MPSKLFSVIIKSKKNNSPGYTSIILLSAIFIGALTQYMSSFASSDKIEMPYESIKIEMITIPAGNFTMGSNNESDEKPVHTVYLNEYKISKYTITVGQFKKFVNATGYNAGNYWKKPGFSQKDNHPVVNVSWNDAVAFCKWAEGRLPTEAECEKAARGTDGRKYPWGNSNPSGNLLNFADNNTNFNWSDKNVNDGYEYTSPVGNYPSGASPYGVMDMVGNVWEWCSDWYDSNYYANSPSSNPTGPTNGTNRVNRGGSWFRSDYYVRCAYRNYSTPVARDNSLGFRLVNDR